MRIRLLAVLALSLTGAAGTAQADDAALRACRAVADGTARLACYDALPLAASPAQSFGLDPAKREDAPQAVESTIESTIAGRFAGWGPSTLFTLANGQVWKVVDGSQAELQPVTGPQVRIVRNLFGTMFLEIEGTNASPKVRRVR
jgi:type II secretory pathway pseudopilin PulG